MREENKLIKIAKRYDKSELTRFLDELGWMEWMNDYTEASDGDVCTEAELCEIDRIAKIAFEKAHE